MPGNESLGTTGRASPFFYYDEGLSSKIGEVLAHVGYSVEVGAMGVPDGSLISEMGSKGQTWITKDDRARVEHEAAIQDAGISIVFVRGQSHGRRRRDSLRRNVISLKETLLLLVNKLDAIEAEISSSNRARYFILFLKSPGRPDYEKHSTLREVWQRLSGSG